MEIPLVWQNKNNSCEKTNTVISAIIIVTIELVLVVKICKKLGPRISKQLFGKRPQKCTNSRTPEDKNELNEDQDSLLTANITDAENEIDS